MLATYESVPTLGKKLLAFGIENNINNRKTSENIFTMYRRDSKATILEPELSYESDYSIDEIKFAAKKIYSILFKYLNTFNIYIPGII